MNSSLLDTLKNTQSELDPRFKALKAATVALTQAAKLAGEEKADALAMQKVHNKLAQAAELLDDHSFRQAVSAFEQETRAALDALAFEFARNLKELFEQRGETVEGRPPQLVIGELVLQIDIGARKAQWFYGKEALTRPIPLSLSAITKAFDAQKKAILGRAIDGPAFMQELYAAWQKWHAKKERKAAPGARVPIVDLYSEVVLNRQSARFWNSPSRSTFKDYERPFFVRDLVLIQPNPAIEADGQTLHLRLAGATKNQAESAMRSMWLPSSALDGEYYASVTFER
ncbi:MAG: hypothetical protein R2911_14305 [Caldilineaceae bacterium]